MPKAKKTGSTRRDFLKTSSLWASTVGLPMIVPSSVLGLNGKTPPSNQVAVGCVGTGGKGRHNMEQFLKMDDCRVLGVADVDLGHLDLAKAMTDKHYGNQDCKTAADFREIVNRDDIDAVCVSTPDHWHALASIAALDAGKDVYCEKPLANSVGEGRAICRAAARSGRVLQTGSHERSGDNRRMACELVRNGRIGDLHTIRINLPMSDPHHKKVQTWLDEQPTMPVPEKLNWDMWLGHTPSVGYTEKRCHFWWRFILAHGGGEMTDRGAHVIDLAQLGAGKDDTGPVEFIAKGSRNRSGLFDAYIGLCVHQYLRRRSQDDRLNARATRCEVRGIRRLDLYSRSRPDRRSERPAHFEFEVAARGNRSGPQPGAPPEFHRLREEPRRADGNRGNRSSNGNDLPPKQHRDETRPPAALGSGQRSGD